MAPNRACWWVRRGAVAIGATLALTVPAACGPRWKDTAPTTPAPIPGATTTVPTSTSGVPVTSATTATNVSTTSSPSTVEETTTTAGVAPTSSEVTSTTQDAASAIAAITANWETFFANSSSIDDRVALLEDGESLRAAVEQRAQDPLMGQASAKVKTVELTAPDRATVTYDVLLSGSVALPNAQGTAVLLDGVWKVGAASFCALITLGATAPIPGC